MSTRKRPEPLDFWLHHYPKKTDSILGVKIVTHAQYFFSEESLPVMFQQLNDTTREDLLRDVIEFADAIRKMQDGRLPPDAIVCFWGEMNYPALLRIEAYALEQGIISTADVARVLCELQEEQERLEGMRQERLARTDRSAVPGMDSAASTKLPHVD